MPLASGRVLSHTLPNSLRPDLGALKARLAETGTSYQQDREKLVMFSGLRTASQMQGFRRGTIVEWSGSSKTEAVVQVLREHPQARVAWLEETFTLYPPALLQHQAGLKRILFVETGNQTLWSLLQVLRSSLFDFIVVLGGRTFHSLNDSDFRKIQMATEKSGGLVFLLNPSRSETVQANSFAISVRIKAKNIRIPNTNEKKMFLTVTKKEGA